MEDLRYLELLAREFPDERTLSAEIINLNAILNLPKGTEHFVSDIHGEHEAFLHLLRNASGVIYEKIELVYSKSLTPAERQSLAALIYYPKEKLEEAKARETSINDWYRIMLYRLTNVCRATASKYSRARVRSALPEAYAYIIEELLGTPDQYNKERYYEQIIRAIVDTGSAEEMICTFASLIQRLAVEALHIVGDIYDRGPHADVILNHLMQYHRVDIQWGNHDALWMGAAAGSQACVATAVRNCVLNDNLDMLENGYGINLLPLALFATELYDDASVFAPRRLPQEPFKPRDLSLYARMLKAISVILFKLEGQLVHRRPEYGMEDRDMFSRVDWTHYDIEIDGKRYPLRDRDFPTVDPQHPTLLTAGEGALMEQLTASFRRSQLLQDHVRFLYSNGSVYKRINGNLLFHGCVPANADGSFLEVDLGGGSVRGRAYMDFSDRMARQGFFAQEGTPERAAGRDYLWFLWCGRHSPLFGRDHIATFERALIEDESTWHEEKNAYYKLYDDENFIRKIFEEFSLTKPWSRIINGHVPVRVSQGEDPRKAGGRLIVIDGGFCKAYQKKTGIAGYTMFFSSHGIRIAAHEPFTSREEAVRCEHGTAQSLIVENLPERLMISDTDTGVRIQQRIEDLQKLLAAYRSGAIAQRRERDEQ